MKTNEKPWGDCAVALRTTDAARVYTFTPNKTQATHETMLAAAGEGMSRFMNKMHPVTEAMDEKDALARMKAAEHPPRHVADVNLCPLCCGTGEVTAPDGEICRCGWCQGTGED